MTLLARTDHETTDHSRLSMFIAEKTPGTDAAPFPDDGLTGGKIEVLGYRGMKQYEFAFDGFEVAAENLLGGEEGRSFKQLIELFESANRCPRHRRGAIRARAALAYAETRMQFSKPLVAFPRVADKLAMMAVEIMVARQLIYHAAFEKDRNRRCDVGAGMAKLLGARVAWAAADNGVQIHGGNGFALEYPFSRILCDTRILDIFDGCRRDRAQVIARRLLG